MSTKKHSINLIRGWPAPELLPVHHLRESSRRALSDPTISIPGLEYAPDAGFEPLREGIARWLGAHFRVTPDANRICISGGASQNLMCILQTFSDPAVTRAVWMVAPGYHLAPATFEDAGFAGRLRAFPEDEEGVDLDELESRIRKVEAADEASNGKHRKPFKNPKYGKYYRHIVYIVPTCANPSGKIMSLRRREGLVRLARKYDALIICDDVYDMLQWPVNKESASPASFLRPDELPEMLLPRLCDIDRAMGQSPDDPEGFGYAVSNGSFSKLVGPGMRTGWLEGSPAFAFGLSQTGATKSGGAGSQFAAITVSDMLQSGVLHEWLATTVRPALQRRHHIISEAVREYLYPLGVSMRETGSLGGGIYGGYFVWLTLPDGFSAETVTSFALREENLIVGNGSMFQVPGDDSVPFDYAIRLCFSYLPEEDLVEGVCRLASVLQKLKETQGKDESLSRKTWDESIF